MQEQSATKEMMRLKKLQVRKIFPRTTTRNAWKAVSVLFIGLISTALATFYTHQDQEKDAYTDLRLVCADLKNKIQTRLHSHAELLQCGSALFASSDSISREEWKSFNEYSKIKTNLHGIQGLGFSLIIPGKQIKSHIVKTRRSGLPDYSIKPDGDREVYTSVIYLEPVSCNQLQALGYDMFTEPTRRKAMEQSRDSDKAMLSGKIVWEPKKREPQQAGALMYAPVYQRGLPLNTVAQRRMAIKGWIFSPYKMNDLMQGILERWDMKSEKRIRLQIYDDNILLSRSLLYDSQPDLSDINCKQLNHRVFFPIEFNGKKWMLNFSQGHIQSNLLKGKVLIVLPLGIIISFLLFSLSLSLFNTQYRANEIASQLTAELKESESRFKNMFKRHDSIMLLIDPTSGSIIDANLAASSFYGFPVNELCTMSINVLNTMSEEIVEKERKKAANQKQNFFIFTHKLADGQKRIVEVHSSPIKYMGKIILFSIIHDITERKQAEEALKESEERWKFAIEGSNDGLWDWNITKNEVYFSAQWKNMLGYSLNEIGNTIHELEKRVHHDDVWRRLADIEQHLNGDTPFYSSTHRIACKDGTYKWILDRGKVVQYDQAGKPIRMIGTHTDMTERIKMEKQLRQLNADKDQFMSIMAHDLRSPFNSILGFLDLIKAKIHQYSIEQIERNITIVLQSAQNTYHLLDDLLSWSQAQSNKLPYDPMELEFKEIFKEVAGILKLNADNKKITLKYNAPSEIIVFADKNMLCTILRNLISNAIKFTPTEGCIEISAIEAPSHVTISVADNGIGISQETAEKLFRMSQIHTTLGTENEKGNGFGLLLCKDFVEKHGGSIFVESSVGEGSRFTFILPTLR